MKTKYDIVIVGSGIGGISTLLYLTETSIFKKGKLSICLISKEALHTTNTNWAQGGIAVVNALEDNFEKHIEDTLIAGAFTNNKKIVEKVIKAAPEIIKDLIQWGSQFDKNNYNQYDLAKEGGHSFARILHYQDQTGKSIQTALINKLKSYNNVDVIEYCCLMQAKNIYNNFTIQLYHKIDNSFITLNCTKLVLATGGLGMLYEKTTNNKIATGDGIFIANSLGAEIENLSFVQFHPTGLYENSNTSFLITEALRGAGAKLKNENNLEFMRNYDERLDLAPRDIVSRAIYQEINKQSLKHVYLDSSSINPFILKTKFPTIYSECKKRLNINIEKEMIPVVPTQHYSCGGIKVNEFGESSIPNLFAIGETAATGLHGANRLASNSLLEAVAFAKFSTTSLIENLKNEFHSNYKFEIGNYKQINKNAIKSILTQHVGIIKTNSGLKNAKEMMLHIVENSSSEKTFNYENFEATVMLEVALLLVQDAQCQQINKGVYYNTDLN